MTAPEQLFWGEVASDKATARSLAVCYALLIAFDAGRLNAGHERDPEFWPEINKAINVRLGFAPTDHRKIDRFRQTAWKINEAACNAKVPA